MSHKVLRRETMTNWTFLLAVVIATVWQLDLQPHVQSMPNTTKCKCSYPSHGGRARMAQWVRQLDYLATHSRLLPIRRRFAPGFANYKQGCTRLAAASDKVYQLLAHGRLFYQGTPDSSITKTGRHDIAEILLKVALNHQKYNQSDQTCHGGELDTTSCDKVCQ